LICHGHRSNRRHASLVSEYNSANRARERLVLVAVESTEALRDFVLDSLTKRREVAGVRTEVVFDHLENHVVTPAGPA
jgi:hypothetical protein